MIARSQRERLLEAAVDVVAEKGYGATTVADLTREAGISRTTFYEMFEDKEACFLAAYDSVADALVRRVAAAYEARGALAATGPAPAWRRCSRRSPRSPQVARLALVDVGSAGPAGAAPLPGGAAAADAALRRGPRLRPGRPQACRPTPRGWRSAPSPG